MTGDGPNSSLWRRKLLPWAAAALAVLVHGALQATRSGMAEFDAYFHVGVALQYQQDGLTRTFPWLSASILRDGFNDRDFVLHLLGWAGLAGGLPPASVASVLPVFSAAVLAGTLCWFLMRRGVVSAFPWTAWWLVGSAYVLVRMSFVKSTSLFMALVLLFMDALLLQRGRRAVFTCWLAVLTYQGYPLLLVIALGHDVVTRWRGNTTQRFWGTRVALLGLAAGLVLNPFFPYNMDAAYYEYVVQFVSTPTGVQVGGEWLPLDPARFLAATVGTLVFLVHPLRRWRDLDAAQFLFFAFSLVLLVGSLRSARGIEHFVLWGTVAAAVFWKRATPLPKAALVLGTCVAAAWGALNWDDARRTGNAVAQAARPDEFRGGAAWLETHTAKDEIIAAAWDDTSILFYFNRHNRYLYAINPAYGCGYSRDLCTAMELVYAGRVRDPESFLERASSRVLVVGRSDAYPGRTALVQQLRANPLFEEVFQSGGLSIFRWREAPQR